MNYVEILGGATAGSFSLKTYEDIVRACSKYFYSLFFEHQQKTP